MLDNITKEDILKKYEVKDFRSMKVDQWMDFITSTIPKMDKTLALECIKQSKYFEDCASKIVGTYSKLCSDYLQDNELTKLEIYPHQKAIDACCMRIEQIGSNMSENEFFTIMDWISDEERKISETIERHQQRKHNVIKMATAVAGLAITAGAAAIGVRIDKFPIPKI